MGVPAEGSHLKAALRRIGLSSVLVPLTALSLASAGVLALLLRVSRVAPRISPNVLRMAIPGASTGEPFAAAEAEPQPLEAPPRMLSRAQAVLMLAATGVAAFGLFANPVLTLAIVNGLVMGFFAAANVMKLALIHWSLRHPDAVVRHGVQGARVADDDLPIYTILLPLYREASILPQLISGIEALDYPTERLDVKLLLERDDDATREAAESMSLPACFEVLTVPDVGPVGKSRACNHGLARARGEFLVIYDAEDSPEPDQLRKSVAAFGDQGPDVACLQAKLNYFNRKHNLLTRWFTAEYSVWFDQLLPGLSHLGVAVPLGGTSNHFVTDRLRELDGWSVYNVTEDADLGVRIFLRGWQTSILDSTTFEEATSRYGNWLRQRSRWVKGYMQTYLRFTAHPLRLRRQMGWRAFTAFHLFFGASTVCLLVNPAYILLIAVWYGTRAHWIQSVFPASVLYLGTVGLFIGNAACVVSAVSGCYARRNYGDVKWALLTPVYWLLMSVAAFKALFQLLFKPWYWEKTDHGFLALADHSESTVRSNGVARRALVPAGIAGGSGLGAGSVALPAPAVRVERDPRSTPAAQAWARARVFAAEHELTVVVLAALLAAAAATAWSAATNSMVLYGDAAAHLDVARRVTDGVRVGLAQLGSVWLPLPHLLLVPLVSLRVLWHSAAAGAILSGVCFVYSAVRIYTLVLELTGSRRGAWCAFSLFALNLNILYVQSTALTEPVLLAFCIGAIYHLALWMRTFWMGELIWASVLTCAATLSRYEGWGLLALGIVTVALWGRIADRRQGSGAANALLFVVIGAYGVVLWFLYNLIIFHDPLYFLHSIYSAQAINGGQAQFGLLGTSGNIGTSLLTFGWVLIGVVGAPVLIAAGLSLALLTAPHARRRRTLVVLALLAAPVLFDLATLYAGQITIRVSELAPHQLWNLRYGLVALPLCAVAVGCAAARGRLLAAVAVAVVAATATVMAINTPVTLTDGRNGISSANAEHRPLAALFLRAHYRGGEVLADDGSASSLIYESDLDLNRFISPGDHPDWENALDAPVAHAAWVVVYPNDAIDVDLRAHPARFADFRLVAASGRARLFRRVSAAASANAR